MKSEEQIKKQIEALEKIRPNVRPYSAFGDDNLAALDAQIKVLKDDMDNDDIWDEWPEEEADLHTRDSAFEARRWPDDEAESDNLAKDWPLIKT